MQRKVIHECRTLLFVVLAAGKGTRMKSARAESPAQNCRAVDARLMS